MAYLYVSDLLENLLGAGETRSAVRKFCKVIVEKVPASAKPKLEEGLHYIAGKCMGYPAVWLCGQALRIPEKDLDQYLDQCAGPLLVSLTTSVADDFVDHDDSIGPEHMMLMYLMIFESLKRSHWFNGDMEKLYLQDVYPLIPGFVEEGKTKNRTKSGDSLYSQARNAGLRIGAFHKTIAHALTNGLLTQEKHEHLVSIAGKFGEWCSNLDDIIDIELDILQGANISMPIYAIRQHSTFHASAIDNRDIRACMDLIESPEFINRISSSSVIELVKIAEEARTVGFIDLASKLMSAVDRIPSRIAAVRKQVSAHYRSMNNDYFEKVEESAQPITA